MKQAREAKIPHHNESVSRTTGQEKHQNAVERGSEVGCASGHHGLAVVFIVGCGGCHVQPMVDPPSPELFIFLCSFSVSMRFCPFCAANLSLKLCIWLHREVDSKTQHPHKLIQTLWKPPLKREKQEEEGLGEGNNLEANREIDILART